MPKYTVYFTQTASASVTIEAPSRDEAEEAAYQEVPGSLCASCSGWGSSVGVELGGDWEVFEVEDAQGNLGDFDG